MIIRGIRSMITLHLAKIVFVILFAFENWTSTPLPCCQCIWKNIIQLTHKYSGQIRKADSKASHFAFIVSVFNVFYVLEITFKLCRETLLIRHSPQWHGRKKLRNRTRFKDHTLSSSRILKASLRYEQDVHVYIAYKCCELCMKIHIKI